MFCPMCGAPNEEDSVFCGNCGAVLDPDEVPVDVAVETTEEAVEGAAQASAEAVEDVPVAPEPKEAVAGPPAVPAPPVSVAPSLPTSGLAIASLVCGVGGLVVFPLIGSILAVIFGYMARRDIRQRPHQISGDGVALAGIVTGWIGVGFALLGLLVGGAMLGCGMCGALSSGNW